MSNLNSLSYYAEHAPQLVNRTITDTEAHFQCREALYRHLGIPVHFLREKKILEFGPGCGHNSLFLLEYSPAQFTLVDGFAGALAHAEILLRPRCPKNSILRFVVSPIESYHDDTLYDLVLCEAVLPLQQSAPDVTLRAVARHVAPQGLLVITCADAMSLLPEIARRIMGQHITRNISDISQKIQVLKPFFSPHFAQLQGMQRPIEDWILDVVFQPHFGPLFSIEDAMKCLPDFDIYQSSPHFITDWRWYRQVPTQAQPWNTHALHAMQSLWHNFLDYRRSYPPRAPEANMALGSLAQAIFNYTLVQNKENSVEILENCIQTLSAMVENLEGRSGPHADTSIALEDLARAFQAILDGSMAPDCGAFTHIFGRGQQFVSFIKH